VKRTEAPVVVVIAAGDVGDGDDDGGGGGSDKWGRAKWSSEAAALM